MLFVVLKHAVYQNVAMTCLICMSPGSLGTVQYVCLLQAVLCVPSRGRL